MENPIGAVFILTFILLLAFIGNRKSDRNKQEQLQETDEDDTVQARYGAVMQIERH